MVKSGRRTVAGVIVALLAGLGGTIAAASPAQAQEVDVLCAGTLTTNLSPGLLLEAQTITTQNTFIYSPCTSTTDPTDPPLSSGTYSNTVVGTFSCVDLGGSFTGSETITWDNGHTSTFTFNATYATVGAQFVTLRHGSITAGLFAGQTAMEEVVGPTPNLLNCLHPPGITSRTSTVALKIFGL